MLEKERPNRTLSSQKLYSVLIGLLPVVMFYRVPLFSFGMATLLVGVTLPFALLAVFNRKKTPAVLAFLLLWLVYMIIRSRNSNQTMFLLSLVLLHVWGALKGSIDFRVLRKTIEVVSIWMAVIVSLQTAIFYTTHIQPNFLIRGLILPENQHALDRGLAGSLYRPSALFLEPSHYTQYCCFGLLSVLFPYEKNAQVDYKKAIFIAVGCILTTSGMGIVLIFGIFAWFILFQKRQKGDSIVFTVLWILFGVIVFFLLMRLSFFNSAVARIQGEDGEHGAIWGRTLFWDSYIGTMSGKDLIIGYGSLIEEPTGYMTGLMSLIYQYGYVGVALLAIALIALCVYGKDNFTICACVVYAGLMIIANKAGFLSYIFNLCLIAASAYSKRWQGNNYRTAVEKRTSIPANERC